MQDQTLAVVCLQSVFESLCFYSQYVGKSEECLHMCLLHPEVLGPHAFAPCVFMLLGTCHTYGAHNCAQWPTVSLFSLPWHLPHCFPCDWPEYHTSIILHPWCVSVRVCACVHAPAPFKDFLACIRENTPVLWLEKPLVVSVSRSACWTVRLCGFLRVCQEVEILTGGLI